MKALSPSADCVRKVAARASHSFTTPFSLPVAKVLPSGVNARQRTRLVCPSSVANSFPVATSHSLAVLASLAVAKVLPSGANAS